MSTKSKGQEFFENLSEVEQQTIITIIKLENDPDRLKVGTSVVLERKIKDIIIKNAVELNDNDI